VTGTPQPHYSDLWYSVVEDDSLRQGDIFRNLLVFWLPQDLLANETGGDDQPVEVARARGDWIITSASCDVANNRYPLVFLSRVLPATQETLNEKSAKDFRTRLEVLRRGFEPTRFLLAECPNIEPAFPLSYVDYRVHALLPHPYLKRNCRGPRLRLKHPMREQFGVWAGANLSRVGPEDDTKIPGKGGAWPSDVLRANEET
jgi:hypothetical protein